MWSESPPPFFPFFFKLKKKENPRNPTGTRDGFFSFLDLIIQEIIKRKKKAGNGGHDPPAETKGWWRGRRRGAVWSCLRSATYSGLEPRQWAGRGRSSLCINSTWAPPPALLPRTPSRGASRTPLSRGSGCRGTAAPWVAATRGCRKEPAP